MNTPELEKIVLDILDDMKAQNVVNLDVTQQTDIADRMIICDGTSSRHIQSMADRVMSQVKSAGVKPLGIEGFEHGEWILVDLGDIIVHFMLPKTREFYSLEKLWSTTEQVRREHAN